MEQSEEIDLISRALALRKLKRIGVLWSYQGSYYVSSSDLDPFGTRSRVSLDSLKTMVEEAERSPPIPRIGPTSKIFCKQKRSRAE